MSYILDALKKSEEERKRGTVPDLLAVQDALGQKQKRRHVWPYLLLAALVLNAGTLLWWLAPWQTAKPPVTTHSSAKQSPLPEQIANVESGSRKEKPAPAQDTPLVKSSAGKRVSDLQNPSVQIKAAQQERVASTSAPSTGEMQESRAIPPLLPPQAPATSPALPETKPSVSSGGAGGTTVYNLTELPSTIQQGLPTFSITALIHTGDPASGMVKINGQTMREGQELSPGLKLEEIISDGVIFRYHNYRFRVGLK
jgi:general secretion pathway protein B